MTATIYGKPLRDPSWSSLHIRQRLVRELDRWLASHPPAIKSLLIFWHSARTYALATLAKADCHNRVSLCLNVANLQDVGGVFSSIFPWCSLVAVRLVEKSPRAVGIDKVPIPPDFSQFDEDKETKSITPLPLIGQIAGTYQVCGGAAIKTELGLAPLALTHVSVPKSWVEWFLTEGHDLYRSERLISATFMPHNSQEATFLQKGLYLQNATGLIPIFPQAIPWDIPSDAPLISIDISYIPHLSPIEIYTLSLLYYEDIEHFSANLYKLIEEAKQMITSGVFFGTNHDEWSNKCKLWESELKVTVENWRNCLGPGVNAVSNTTLTIYVLPKVPGPGTWVTETGKFLEEVERYYKEQDSEPLRTSPFLVAALH